MLTTVAPLAARPRCVQLGTVEAGLARSRDGPTLGNFPIGRSMAVGDIGAAVRRARLAQGRRRVGVRSLVELERGKPTVRLAKVLAVLDALGLR